MSAINLADAKARFSALIDRVVAGESVDILKRGKTVARIMPSRRARTPIDLDRLRALTGGMAASSETAEDFVRRMRDGDRY